MTDLQASLFAEQTYENKWIRIRGPIDNVMGSSYGATLVFRPEGIVTRVALEESEIPKVVHLEKGDTVTVEAQFKLMDRIGPDFEKGEIISE